MIKYNLICENRHEFEGWFDSSISCDDQLECNLVECPECDSFHIGKAIMAPSVKDSKHVEKAEITKADIEKYVDENFEDVGDEFTDELRAIHYGEAENRNIKGKISIDDFEDLQEDGIEIIPLPSKTLDS